MKSVCLFYSDAQADWQKHLSALATFDIVVCQAEFAWATKDSEGREYAHGETPVEYLDTRGVGVSLYVNPFFVADANKFGGPGESYRLAQARAVEGFGAWLRDGHGNRILSFPARQQFAVDISNAAYWQWLLDHTPPGNLFVDCGFYHAQVYNKHAGPNNEYRAVAIRNLYGAWRNQGRRVVVNSGWEMFDPNVATWLYPFAGFVDGVAVEVPMGISAPNGWWDLVTYKNTPAKMDRLRRLVKDWGHIWLLAVWQRDRHNETYSPFPTFAEHVNVWRSEATAMGVGGLACYKSTHEALPFGVEPDAPVPPSLGEQVAALERRVSRLETLAGF